MHGKQSVKSAKDGEPSIWMSLLVVIWIGCTLIILFNQRAYTNQTTELFFDGHWESGFLNDEGPNGEEIQTETTAFIPISQNGLVFKLWVGKGLLFFLALTTLLGYLAFPKTEVKNRYK